MIELRDYQLHCNDLIRKEFSEKKKRLLVVAPPGAGKGTIIGYQASTAAKRGLRVLIFMHKRELVIQQAKRIANQFGYHKIGFYLSGVKCREMPIMIGTVQTMTKRKISDFDLIILDEGHRIKTNQHQLIYDKFKDKYFIAFTATPFRGDKKGFSKEFDSIVQFITYNELVQKKALVPTVVNSPKISPDLDGVHIKLGEFVDKELFDKFNEERIYRGVVEKWIELANGKKTIIFNVNDKSHSKKTAEWFQKYGIDARAIDSDTPMKEREELLDQFAKNKYPVLCNIGLFTEGISIDDTECIVFNVATKVLTKWVQAAARGSRPVFNEDMSDWAKGPDGKYIKPHCLIIDFGGNAKRFGYVDDYDIIPFTLDGTPPVKKEAALKDCPVCDRSVYVQTRVCPDCGHVFEIKNKDKRIYADEVEWEIVDRVLTLVERFQKMSATRIEKAKPPAHILRAIAKARNYRPAWAAHMAYRLGYTDINPAVEPRFGEIYAYLQLQEKNAGVENIMQVLEEKMTIE